MENSQKQSGGAYLHVTDFKSPFLKVPENAWLCSNELAFAVFDNFPVSPGHTLVITRRVVATWFDASPEEQKAVMELVNRSKEVLDARLKPRPDGYNVGFNAGRSAGQTVPHLHVHVIPRYSGDVADPRGGVRHVIPGKGNYLKDNPGSGSPAALQLSVGHPKDPIWSRIEPRLQGATEIDILASFVQPSGLDLLQSALFLALRAGARARILVGDYLSITDPEALRRLLLWMDLAREECTDGSFEVRLAEIKSLKGQPESFHPKAWRIADQVGGMVVVGSSNLSRPALQTGVEWNLVGSTGLKQPLHLQLQKAFVELWEQSTVLTHFVVERYAESTERSRKLLLPPEAKDVAEEPKSPRPWQKKALDSLVQVRSQGFRRALIAVATGLGKTWLAAFDALWLGEQLERRPRVLIVAHRAEILIQAEATFRAALNSEWEKTKVSWYLGSASDMAGNLVIASVQKLSRPEGLSKLALQQFDYAVIDEVHHAEAPSYRKVLARLHASFTVGLTATPERTDGVDVASLFDDVLAWQATIGDGIEEGSLVPFHYVGLKDDIDFQQIPWRNGRFDPATLEQRLENSQRMERLWSAWNKEPAARTLVFCCSRRHAVFSRDWLRRRGVRAAAVFSGEGGDPRGQSLADLVEGNLDALCVVDLFNEGLDVPNVDRVVMLRPTESKVVFIQQLGRGLRATEGKSRLIVVDFVGNHRIFASRLLHLLSLGQKLCNYTDLEAWLKGRPPELPPGCLIDVELEARDILQKLLPTGGSAAIEAYRAMRDELQRRPTMTELFYRGYPKAGCSDLTDGFEDALEGSLEPGFLRIQVTRSAANAIKWGLFSRQVVLDEQERRELELVSARVHELLQPSDPTEEYLADEVAASWLRLARCLKIETGLFRAYSVYQMQACGLGTAFAQAAQLDCFGKLTRYEAHLERKLAQALRRFQLSRVGRHEVPALFEEPASNDRQVIVACGPELAGDSSTWMPES